VFVEFICMINVLNRGFSRLSVDALVTKVMTIISQLTGNAAFPITDPTIAQLQAALDALKQALVLTNPEARDAAIEAARAPLEQLLEDLR
jgi:hypothetical protein